MRAWLYTQCMTQKILLTLSVSLLFSSAVAWARPPKLQEFRDAYPQAKSLHNCQVCHQPAMPKLNAYGLDYKKADKKLSAIEKLDSDSDGVSNIDEIHKGTPPGIKN